MSNLGKMKKEKITRTTEFARFAFTVEKEKLRLAHCAAHAQGMYLTELCREFISSLSNGDFLDARKQTARKKGNG